MTYEVNAAMRLKGSEGVTDTHKGHFIHVNNFKSTNSTKKFLLTNKHTTTTISSNIKNSIRIVD